MIPANYSSPAPTANRQRNNLPITAKPSVAICKKSGRKKPVCRPECRSVSSIPPILGRNFGIMVPYDGTSNQALSVDEVEYETNALYLAAVQKIRRKGITIQSITCDDRQV
ncbi:MULTISPECIES: hypothetical protein [unclassified Neisseria]|uniref:hypothetical protein n=1 Tax=unclassified Neisseria TaxID=2623750 RepID=UPI001071D92D|nr:MULTISPECIES: hypothetical protein [unclassified Neisseria]MBF0804772.1 hypothetical protein [Neisseria sp. 19428wB4_WF04]TFU39524.1 hypothetical protein E4T99_10630 [Neisseria sp. WF04]TFV04554.1 hypothetical protein E4T85_20610 [Bacillus stratosphericus]